MHTGHPFGRCHVLLTGCLLLMPALDAAPGQSINIRDGNTPLERCDQLDISFDNRPGLRDEEAIQLPVGAEPLTVSLAHQGGIGLREGSANQHEITLCKAVPDDRGADFAAIRAVVKGSSVEVAGPAGKRWAGYVIVRSPRGSHVSLSATNGPVRADSFEGDLNVRTTNGPIALMHVRGRSAHARKMALSKSRVTAGMSRSRRRTVRSACVSWAHSGKPATSWRGPRTGPCRSSCRRNIDPVSRLSPPVTRRGPVTPTAARETTTPARAGRGWATVPRT